MIVRIAASVLFVVATCSAMAQPKKAPAEKISPRPVQPAPPTPARNPAEPPVAASDRPFVYSPWTKFCGRDNSNPQAKEVCLTVKEARLETGQFLAGAALIEQQGEEKKLLRITLPLGMQLMPGVRMLLDQDPALTGRYVVCLPNGCIADIDVNAEFVGKLKRGQQIVLQGINLPGQAASYLLPLGGFAAAIEGPPTDPKQLEREQIERRRDAPSILPRWRQ